MFDFQKLSGEQRLFVEYAMNGRNVLVDACIGSGKTTAIQALCALARSKHVLYLTYNKLLKLDAISRIRNPHVTVTNHHGFAWSELNRVGIHPGLSELIQVYNKKRPKPSQNWDVLVLDEYQDIDQEISEMLWHIKKSLPSIQIIAVGDMAQKIYDKTRLDVQSFISKFLGDYIPMEFTLCFRLGKEHAAMLGRIWKKKIVGVNEDFEISYMPKDGIVQYAATLKPEELLVLGSKSGEAAKLQNHLETYCADTFNKHTLWSKVANMSATSPTPECAIFTTYDGCKGMERDVCIVYDWTSVYWQIRLAKPDTKYEILRNVFCVAASRGKRRIIIAYEGDEQLSEDDLLSDEVTHMKMTDTPISEMFDYKFVEDVEKAYGHLDVTEVQPAGQPIEVPLNDALIDLSSPIAHYQKAMFFKNYDIDEEIEYYAQMSDRNFLRRQYAKYDLDKKLLYLAALETKQLRYLNQVYKLPISGNNEALLKERLSTMFSAEEKVQCPCYVEFYKRGQLAFSTTGIADVVTSDYVWKLGFQSAISHVDILQLAMHMAGLKRNVGRIWNIRTNQMFEVRIRDKVSFLDAVARATTKGRLKRWGGDEA